MKCKTVLALATAIFFGACASTVTTDGTARVRPMSDWPAASASRNEVVATNGHDSVWLSNVPCSSKAVLAMVSSPLREQLYDAHADVAGKHYRACWEIDGQEAHLLYEDGDQGLVPLVDFHRQAGA